MDNTARAARSDSVRALRQSEGQPGDCLWAAGIGHFEQLLDQLGGAQPWAMGAELAQLLDDNRCVQRVGTGD